MMRCPKCDGHGFELLANRFGCIRKLECDLCNGTGYLPTTNEEWFCSLSTEEKAKWFGDWHSFSCVFCKHWQNGCIYNHNQVRCAIEEGKSNKELWMEWLKQPHTNE